MLTDYNNILYERTIKRSNGHSVHSETDDDDDDDNNVGDDDVDDIDEQQNLLRLLGTECASSSMAGILPQYSSSTNRRHDLTRTRPGSSNSSTKRSRRYTPFAIVTITLLFILILLYIPIFSNVQIRSGKFSIPPVPCALTH